MRISNLKNGSIRFRGVSSEPQYSHIADTAWVAGCKETTTEHMTVVTISGTEAQMKSFVELYNS